MISKHSTYFYSDSSPQPPTIVNVDDSNNDGVASSSRTTITTSSEPLNEHEKSKVSEITNDFESDDHTSIKNENVKFEDDDDDDDDDGINLILISDDKKIAEEVNEIVRKSLTISSTPSIAVLYNNQLVLIPYNVKISQELSAFLWPTKCTYAKSSFFSMSVFNEMLECLPSTRRERFAIFAVHYEKRNHGLVVNNRPKSNDARPKSFEHGKYLYTDFAAAIIEDKRIIDYAIHGYKSNISKMIEINRPRRIYYNKNAGKYLDVFMKYSGQPFYKATHKIMTPISIKRDSKIQTCLFCERHTTYCAFCHLLREIVGFFSFEPSQSIQQPDDECESSELEEEGRLEYHKYPSVVPSQVVSSAYDDRTHQYSRTSSSSSQHYSYHPYRRQFKSSQHYGLDKHNQPTHNRFKQPIESIKGRHVQMHK